jgi:glycosyltransferase involved in cell wall biosynthesis
MALLEALAAGVPAVITDDTGPSELVRNAGAGIVTDGSPEQLAAGVLRLLDGAAWAPAADAALRLATERFGLPAVAARLAEIYGAAAEQRVAA